MGGIFATNWECKNDKCQRTPAGKQNWFQCKYGSCTPHNCSGSPNYECKPAKLGAYRNAPTCTMYCKKPVDMKWACNSTGQCVLSTAGTYDDRTSCEANCSTPVLSHYVCSGPPNYLCAPTSDNTPYTSNLACASACVAPSSGTYYACSGAPNYSCSESILGAYADQTSCRANCKAQSMRWNREADHPFAVRAQASAYRGVVYSQYRF